MPSSSGPKDRLRLLGIVAFSMFAALGARLWYVQILNTEEYQEVATAQITRTVHEEAPRGEIFDRSGRLLVTNRVTTAVTADRRVLDAALSDDETTEMLKVLAVQINRSARSGLVKISDLEAELANESYGNFEDVILALDVDPSLLVYLGERSTEFPGISVERTTVRDYPYGETAAHLLGYVGSITEGELESKEGLWDPADPDGKAYQPNDEIGKTGIEAIFEDELRGTPGRQVLEVDRSENIIRDVLSERREPVPGNDIHLTIDIDLQVLAERELSRALDRARDQPKVEPNDAPFNAPAGASVGLDPRDGSVLFMASYPTYDPADFVGGISQADFDVLRSEEAHSPVLNRVLQGLYAPGSTFKLVTALSAFEAEVWGTGSIAPWDVNYDDKGYYDVQNCEGDTCRFYNAGETPHGGVDLPAALTVSSDAYFYRLGEAFWIRRDLPEDGIQQTAGRYGFGAASGVALPNEASGVVPDEDLFADRHEENPEAFPRGKWSTGDNVNLSIGQGDMRATPLQIANAYATFANGGRLHQPNVVTEIRNPQGDTVRSIGPRVSSQIDLPESYSAPILEGLLGVTFSERGTAYRAFHGIDGGVSFPLFNWPVAGKTGTAEVDGKADFAVFAAFGPTPLGAILEPEEPVDDAALVADPDIDATVTSTTPPFRAAVEPEIVMVSVLEEAGFGSDTAAPMVARVLERVANNTVLRAPVAEELALCASVDLEAAGDDEAGLDVPASTVAPTEDAALPASTTVRAGDPSEIEVAADLVAICAEIYGSGDE